MRSKGVSYYRTACGGMESDVVDCPVEVPIESRPDKVCRKCWAVWKRTRVFLPGWSKPSDAAGMRIGAEALALPSLGETRELITGEVQRWTGVQWASVKGTSLTYEDWRKRKEKERARAIREGSIPEGYTRTQFRKK